MSESPTLLLDGRVRLHAGDCLAVLRALPEASLDSCVTDPPYHLTSIVKRFGAPGDAPARVGATGAYARASRGFMGQTWDGGDIAFRPELWAEVLRVLKPGGHMAAFSGTRTYHRMACAIEDAGFEIRDQLGWVYGSGFPKSLDVSKAIDKAAGVTRAIVGRERLTNDIRSGALLDVAHGTERPAFERDITIATSDAAKQWVGWGTALKPAWEPICLARKPLIGTVAETVLAHGTGALNVGGCRVDYASVADKRENTRGVHASTVAYEGLSESGGAFAHLPAGRTITPPHAAGRWPANILHDGSDEAVAAFGKGAARFFYSAKADADDRIGSKHPTVKPVDLMRWLVRLMTPPGGTVLDPFAGTGTTGEAAWCEGFSAVLVEREAEYQADILRRMALCQAGPAERRRESVKARQAGGAAPGLGPLFAAAPAPDAEIRVKEAAAERVPA